ncbi:hypothetical protein GEMRC1_004287 [Eukaryota sp. GEM-RC1]
MAISGKVSNDFMFVKEIREEIARLHSIASRTAQVEKKYSDLKRVHSIQNQAVLKLQDRAGVLPALKEALTRQQMVIEKLEGHIKVVQGEGSNGNPFEVESKEDEVDSAEVEALRRKVETLNEALIKNAREYSYNLAKLRLKISKLRARLRALDYDIDDSSESEDDSIESEPVSAKYTPLLPPVSSSKLNLSSEKRSLSTGPIRRKGVKSNLLLN